jgi:LPXTG-motif cell wall-anchored protein
VIAIGRKIIILDVTHLEPLTLIGIAAILLALAAGYYFLKKTRGMEDG